MPLVSLIYLHRIGRQSSTYPQQKHLSHWFVHVSLDGTQATPTEFLPVWPVSEPFPKLKSCLEKMVTNDTFLCYSQMRVDSTFLKNPSIIGKGMSIKKTTIQTNQLTSRFILPKKTVPCVSLLQTKILFCSFIISRIRLYECK